MKYKLFITRAASKEADEGTVYYNTIDAKLASRFRAEVLDTYEKLVVNPQLYSLVQNKISSQVRDVKLKSFPYVIIFEVKKETVVILSVFNFRKKPKF